MTIDLTPFLQALIALMGAIALRYIVPWVKSKTTASQREDMLVWVDIAVAAAQQLLYQSPGADRLEYALGILEREGFNIEDKTIVDAVEAAVLKLHEELKNG